MDQKTERKLFSFACFVLCLVGLASCSEGDFTIGKEFIESSTYTAIIDTFSLELSTIKKDSLNTTSSGVALTGFINDSQSGTLTACAYFKADYSSVTIDPSEKFDSLCLILKHSGYYYGDTLSLFGFQVHLTQESLSDLNYSYNSFYNTDTIAYDPLPIGTKHYYPEPSSTDEIRVKIEAEFGESLFDAFQNLSSPTSSDLDTWLKGLVLVPDTTNNRAVIGYDASTDSIILRMYTHLTKQETETLQHDFSASNQALQFNSITPNPQKLGLSTLVNSKQKLTEDKLNNSAILQGGVGYFSRIDFSGLSSMKGLKEEGRIVKATLQVEVLVDSTLYKDLPTTLSLIEADKINQFIDYVADSEGAQVSGILDETGKLYEYSALYTFNITSFVNAMIEEEVIPEESGILLSLPEEYQNNTVDKIVFSGFHHPDSQTKLNVFYYYYDKK